METSPYQDRIEKALTLCGFQRVESGSSDFDMAFIRREFFTSLIFLLKNLKGESVNVNSITDLVNAGRKWCAKNVKARWFSNEAGLNLILMHEGQLSVEVIKEKVDATGMHAAIVQSITAINVSNDSVLQKRTWIVIGKVKEALERLSKVTL